MEPNLPIIAKKFWHMVRVAIFMLRKGISKSKLLADLNFMMKRGKIAGKAIHNLMFHHGHHWAATSATSFSTNRHLHEYEFSCSNTPAHPNLHFPTFHLNKRSKNKFLGGGGGQHHLQSPDIMEDGYVTANAVMKALEMLQSETASPALPGFGRSPMVRQLRITDSPFPLNYVGDEDNHVDEAAENFIQKFYKDLRKQHHAIAAS